jgi:hypothetical protein
VIWDPTDLLVTRASVSKVAMAVGTSANNKDQGQPDLAALFIPINIPFPICKRRSTWRQIPLTQRYLGKEAGTKRHLHHCHLLERTTAAWITWRL